MVCADARGGRCRRRPSTNVACGGGCPRASADPRVVNWMEDDPTSRGSDRGSKEQNVYRFRGRRGGILDPSLSRYARCARTCTPRTGRARSLIRGCGASGDRCNAFRSVFVFRAAAISESAYPRPTRLWHATGHSGGAYSARCTARNGASSSSKRETTQLARLLKRERGECSPAFPPVLSTDPYPSRVYTTRRAQTQHTRAILGARCVRALRPLRGRPVDIDILPQGQWWVAVQGTRRGQNGREHAGRITMSPTLVPRRCPSRPPFSRDHPGGRGWR